MSKIAEDVSDFTRIDVNKRLIDIFLRLGFLLFGVSRIEEELFLYW